MAANKIFELFVVTNDEALAYAREFIDLVESHGGLPEQDVIDNQIPKIFGDRLKWRNQAMKQGIESQKSATVAAYNAFISSKHKAKW
jgi:hypothetical protein